MSMLASVFSHPAQARAKRVAAKLDTVTVERSGWHVYHQMDHVNHHLQQIGYLGRTAPEIGEVTNYRMGRRQVHTHRQCRGCHGNPASPR